MTADPTARRLLLWAVLAAPLSADAQSFSQLSESLGAAPAEVRAPQPVPAAAEGPAGMARVDFLVRSEALHAPGAQLFNPFDTYAKSAGEPGAADIPYLHLARAQAEEQGVDLALILAVIQKESSFDPNALSPKGAVGLMQLMPDTAAWLGLKDARRLTKPEVNIKYGVMYLKYLWAEFAQTGIGDISQEDMNAKTAQMVLAAYNAGQGNVKKYADVPPFKETRYYVKKVTEYFQFYRELLEKMPD